MSYPICLHLGRFTPFLAAVARNYIEEVTGRKPELGRRSQKWIETAGFFTWVSLHIDKNVQKSFRILEDFVVDSHSESPYAIFATQCTKTFGVMRLP
jgi:hypothetical protein